MDESTNTSFANEFADWATTSGLRIALIFVAVWAFRKFGNLIIKRAVRDAIRRDNFASPHSEEQREKTLVSIISTTARVAAWAIAGMLIVQELGVELGPLIAGASVIGVAIGFGAQSLVKDFVSGMFIIMENQYRVGDVVAIAGVSGTVETITMRETILRDWNGHVHHIPNGLVEVATNKTMDFSKINITLSVSYDSDIDKVETIVNEVGIELMNDQEWNEFIEEPPRYIRIHNFGANEIEVKVFGKVSPGKQWAVAGEFRKRIKKAFDKNKIEIPFPQRVIHQSKK